MEGMGMTPNTLMLCGLMGLASAGVVWGVYEGVKAISGTVEGIREENRSYAEKLCQK